MPRYFFHVQDEERIEDHIGVVLPSSNEAQREALRMVATAKALLPGISFKIIVTDERGLPVLELLVVNECRGDRHKPETSAPLPRCGNMDRSAEKNKKRKTARKIVTERLHRYYVELCVICASADESLRRAMQRISGRGPRCAEGAM